MQSYVSNDYMTGITSEWVMSMIENNLATMRVTSLFQAWIESSKNGEDETNQNMINMQMAHFTSR